MKITINQGEQYIGNDGVILKISFLNTIKDRMTLIPINLMDCGFTNYDCEITVDKFQKLINDGKYKRLK